MTFASSKFPFVRVIIQVLDREIKVEALVDTGFDGGITLPLDLIMNGKPPNGYSLWTLADDKVISVPYFFGKVKIGKFKSISAVIIALGNESLIGRGVIDHFRIIFDHGHRVIIEQ